MAGGSGKEGAPAASASSAAAYGHRPQVPQNFSRGGGGGGALLLHPKQLQLPEACPGESLHLPTPARHQGFGSHDGPSKRVPSFPPRSASRAREGSQQQLAMNLEFISTRRLSCIILQLPGQVNNDAECRFQQLANSVHKVGIVLDSVQNDAIRLNRAMKEASLDFGSIQKKVDLLENSLQQILKGQNDLKVLHEGSTIHNPDHLGVLNSGTGKLNEISSTLSVWPEQVQEDLRKLHGDVFGIFTKEMEEVVRAIGSINSKTHVMQMLEDQSRSPNGRPQRIANGSPLVNRMPGANGRLMLNRTTVGNGRPQMERTAGTNGIPQMDRTPVANGRPHMEQIPATKLLLAPSIYSRRVDDLKQNVEHENVKGAQLVGSSYMLAPKQKEVLDQKVNTREPPKKGPVSIIINSDDDSERHISSVILNTEPGDLMKKAGGQEGLQLLQRARKKREITETIRSRGGGGGGGEKRRQKAEPEEEKGEAVHVAAAPAKRARRPNPKYDAAQWPRELAREHKGATHILTV